jgi:hypothetical protein
VQAHRLAVVWKVLGGQQQQQSGQEALLAVLVHHCTDLCWGAGCCFAGRCPAVVAMCAGAVSAHVHGAHLLSEDSFGGHTLVLRRIHHHIVQCLVKVDASAVAWVCRHACTVLRRPCLLQQSMFANEHVGAVCMGFASCVAVLNSACLLEAP